MKKPNHKIAWVCFGLSSFFKSMGKLFKGGKTVVIDPLTLPGWFVLDECLIFQSNYASKKFKGLSLEVYSMPDMWVKQMRILKKK